MKAACDKDCLHCIHPDCILDDPPVGKELAELKQLDRELCPPTSKAQWARERYHNDPEFRAKNLARARAWARSHPERVAEYRRKYNAAHREEIRAKERERYHAKKLKKQAQGG